MRSLLPNLRGLFFCFQCLPCCKPNTRSDITPLLDDQGNPQEASDMSMPFGEQVPANIQSDHSSDNGYELSLDKRSNNTRKTCAIL